MDNEDHNEEVDEEFADRMRLYWAQLGCPNIPWPGVHYLIGNESQVEEEGQSRADHACFSTGRNTTRLPTSDSDVASVDSDADSDDSDSHDLPRLIPDYVVVADINGRVRGNLLPACPRYWSFFKLCDENGEGPLTLDNLRQILPRCVPGAPSIPAPAVAVAAVALATASTSDSTSSVVESWPVFYKSCCGCAKRRRQLLRVAGNQHIHNLSDAQLCDLIYREDLVLKHQSSKHAADAVQLAALEQQQKPGAQEGPSLLERPLESQQQILGDQEHELNLHSAAGMSTSTSHDGLDAGITMFGSGSGQASSAAKTMSAHIQPAYTMVAKAFDSGPGVSSVTT
eukprot:s2538_g22.t1